MQTLICMGVFFCAQKSGPTKVRPLINNWWRRGESNLIFELFYKAFVLFAFPIVVYTDK